MEIPFETKVTLLEVALSYREEMSDHRRQSLFDAIFWLLDQLEEAINAQIRSDSNYCLSFVAELKEEAERCFRERGAFADQMLVMSCCTKLLSCASSSPEKS